MPEPMQPRTLHKHLSHITKALTHLREAHPHLQGRNNISTALDLLKHAADLLPDPTAPIQSGLTLNPRVKDPHNV